MGFFNDFCNAMTGEALKKYETMFKNATDYKLQEWWNEKQYDDDVDDRIKELAEKEMRRRGLYY